MTDVFLERSFEPPITAANVAAMAGDAAGCFGLHQIEWRQSLLAADGARMICWFSAPDAESARIALRQIGADARVLWPGTVHDAPEPCTPNVAATRRFDDAVTIEAIQAIEDAGAWCLETHRVKFARTFFSLDRRRMICLYAAPDAESVRLAQHQAGMPLESVWAFRRFTPDNLAAAADST